MERRHFLKLAFGLAAGAGALAASAQAAPLPPVLPPRDLAPPNREGAEPALVTQDEVDTAGVYSAGLKLNRLPFFSVKPPSQS